MDCIGTIDELTTQLANEKEQLTGDVRQLRRRLTEITAQKDELRSQLDILTEEKMISDRTQEGEKNEWHFISWIN